MPPRVIRSLAGGVPSRAPNAFEVIMVGSASIIPVDFRNVRLLIFVFVVIMRLLSFASISYYCSLITLLLIKDLIIAVANNHTNMFD
jgi:hypothetical protein